MENLTNKDFTSDQEVRWCPGCGDYTILRAMQKALPTLAHGKPLYSSHMIDLSWKIPGKYNHFFF